MNKMFGSKNPMWKGDQVGYAALHEWVGTHLKKPKTCEKCGKKPPHDLANISQKYKRKLSDWEWLCRRCHMLKDGRLDKLKKLSEHNRIHPRKDRKSVV